MGAHYYYSYTCLLTYLITYLVYESHVVSYTLINVQEVYRGDRTVCSVEGLHFDTEYRTRVKTLNRVGCSPYSGVVRIHTAEGSDQSLFCSHRVYWHIQGRLKKHFLSFGFMQCDGFRSGARTVWDTGPSPRFRFRFIGMVARRLKITENEKTIYKKQRKNQ